MTDELFERQVWETKTLRDKGNDLRIVAWKKFFLAWKFCIVYGTATGVLIFIELLHFTLAKLDFFRCTLQSVANHVTAWDKSHAKRDE